MEDGGGAGDRDGTTGWTRPSPGGRPALAECAQWRGHTIVCGLAGIGLRTVEQLHLIGAPVVVVDDEGDRRRDRTIEGWGVPHIVGDSRLPETLGLAGLAGARAVVCVHRDELHTLECALRIRELRPDVRIVSHVTNPSVAGALAGVTGPGSVLDAAELAAPTFVEVCLRRTTHRLVLGGEEFQVVTVDVADVDDPGSGPPATFRSRFGNLAPVAVVSGEEREVVACPGRDHPLAVGDRAVVLGATEDVEQAGLGRATAAPATSGLGGPERLRAWSRQLRALLRPSAGRAFPIALGTLLLLVVVAVVVIRFGYSIAPGDGHPSTLAAVYFTVATLSTLGFGDFSFLHQATWLLIGGIVLIILGVALLTTVFALFTNLLVSRSIEQSLGTRRAPAMRGHVVVVGIGAVGLRVVEGLLASGRRVVVVERDLENRYLGRARALGVPVVVADATQRQTFRSVNLDEAVAVAVLTSNDLTNIEVGLAARELLGSRWSTVPVALRIFDRALARTVETSFGFHHARSTSALAAPFFVGSALGLDILQTFYVDSQPILVGRLTVTGGGGLEGLAMVDLGLRTRVVALRRAEVGEHGMLEHPPRRGTRFAAGDEAYVIGPYEELLAVLQRDAAPGGIPAPASGTLGS